MLIDLVGASSLIKEPIMGLTCGDNWSSVVDAAGDGGRVLAGVVVVVAAGGVANSGDWLQPLGGGAGDEGGQDETDEQL